jgi:long-chain acyl-CoA synthetase
VKIEIGKATRGACRPATDAESSEGDTTAQYFWRKVAERGDQVALRRKHRGIWKSTSWREYGEAARDAGLGLAALGVARGDVVSILSEGCLEWLFADRGIQAIGAISNAIHATDSPGRIRDVLADSRTGVCVVENSEQLQKVLEIRGDLSGLRRLVVIDVDGLHGFRDPMVLSFQDLLNMGREHARAHPHFWDRELAAGRPDEPAVVAYSTKNIAASPRGALLSHSGLMFLLRNRPAVWSQSQDDVQLNLLPLANLTERVLATLLPMQSGAKINFVESADTIDENLQEVKPTHLFATPRHWERVFSRHAIKMAEATGFGRWAYGKAFAVGARTVELRAAGKAPSALQRLAFQIADLLVLKNVRRQYGLARIKHMLVGVDVLADEIFLWFAALGLDLRPVYGLSESSGLAALPSLQARAGRLELGLPGAELKLDDHGEILLHGPHVFMGYLGHPDEGRLDEGWLRTGDVGEIDEEGYLSIVGRRDDRIALEGGRIIAPASIEARLRASPYIAAAMLIGEGRRALSCLVLPDHESVAHYAQSLSVPFTNFASLCAAPEVHQLIRREIDEVNKSLALTETVLDFRIINRSFSPDDREIAKGVRLDRSIVNESFCSLIDDLHGGVEPRFQDYV